MFICISCILHLLVTAILYSNKPFCFAFSLLYNDFFFLNMLCHQYVFVYIFSYNSRDLTNDICMLKLASRVTMSDTISTVCVSAARPAVDAPVHITGWGDAESKSQGRGGGYSVDLRYWGRASKMGYIFTTLGKMNDPFSNIIIGIRIGQFPGKSPKISAKLGKWMDQFSFSQRYVPTKTILSTFEIVLYALQWLVILCNGYKLFIYKQPVRIQCSVGVDVLVGLPNFSHLMCCIHGLKVQTP